jgi:hypothetical protein
LSAVAALVVAGIASPPADAAGSPTAVSNLPVLPPERARVKRLQPKDHRKTPDGRNNASKSTPPPATDKK